MSDILPEFTTKRFIYNALEKNALNKPGCYCVIGAKKIGKTVLLKQLRQHNETNTVYIDASTLGYETNFKDLYKSLEEKGIKNILIDDINKLNEDLIADFNSDTISYANKMCFILSGSICASVRKFDRDICMGGWEYELPPIMYIERLCWEKGLNEVSAEAVKKLSSYSDKYKDIGSHEIDKVIASMELEYMDLVEKEELESCLSVDQLIEKYFG